MTIERPNILLIIADDLGIDTFHIDDANDVATVQLKGTDAYPLPNFSRLVSKGIHFTRAWAHPVCSPTRGSLFTGLHPWRTGVGDAAGPVIPQKLPADGVSDIRTLANVAADAGYQCSIYGKWHLGEEIETGIPTVRGWHRHEGILEGGLMRTFDPNPPNRAEYEKIIQRDVRYVSWTKFLSDSHLDMVREHIAPEDRTHMYATADQIFSARDWIKHVNGKPWWVTLSLFAPHVPFHVPPAGTYTIKFKDPAKPTIQECFVAMMESLDYHLGQFFDDPDPEVRKQLQNTIIILMGDNGSEDELDDTEGDDKQSIYIGGVHVPMIVADGGALFGDGPCYLDAAHLSSEKDPVVHVVDIYQTIIDIIGGEAPSYPTDSISMLPHLKNTSGDAKFANWQARSHNFSQYFVPSDNPHVRIRYQELGERASITDGTYKLNYQNGYYEFSEITFDSTTDLTTERVTNDFEHPKAMELWKALTTPDSPQYAEMDAKGTKFPPLPSVTTALYRYIRLVALSEVNNQPWTSVADFMMLDGNGQPLDRSGWTVTADSQEGEGENGAAVNATDGNQNTIWHTQWYRQSPPHPHELHIDMGSETQLTGFKYRPRQNSENGRIKDYQLFVSKDKAEWVLFASGTFPNIAAEQVVQFPSTAPPIMSDKPPEPMRDTEHLIVRLDAATYQAGDVWEDSSGKNNHATKADGCTMPSLHRVVGYQGKDFNVIRFHSGSGLILPDSLNLQAPYTVMIIDRYYDMLKGRTLQSRDLNWLLGKWYGKNGCCMGNWLHDNNTYDAIDNVFTVMTATLDENHTGTAYLNGKMIGELEGASPPGRLAFSKAGYYNNEVSEADIITVLIWTRVLSESERQQVEGWFGHHLSIKLEDVTHF